MLNFYNYFRKIHPELANRLEELDRNMNILSQGVNDTLIIRVAFDHSDKDDNMFPKGEVFFKDSFGANSTIKLPEDYALHVLRDIKVIMVYQNYECSLLYKTYSDASSGIAFFGDRDDGIELSNNTLTRHLPS